MKEGMKTNDGMTSLPLHRPPNRGMDRHSSPDHPLILEEETIPLLEGEDLKRGIETRMEEVQSWHLEEIQEENWMGMKNDPEIIEIQRGKMRMEEGEIWMRNWLIVRILTGNHRKEDKEKDGKDQDPLISELISSIPSFITQKSICSRFKKIINGLEYLRVFVQSSRFL